MSTVVSYAATTIQKPVSSGPLGFLAFRKRFLVGRPRVASTNFTTSSTVFAASCWTVSYSSVFSFFLSLLFAYMGNTHFVQHGKNLGFALVGRLFHRTTQRSASRLGSGSGSRSSRLRSRFSLHSSSLGSLLSLLLLTLTGLLLVVGVLGDGDFSLFITHVNNSLTMLATKMGAGRISIWNPSRTRAASRVSGNTALMQACSEQRQRQAVSWG